MIYTLANIWVIYTLANIWVIYTLANIWVTYFLMANILVIYPCFILPFPKKGDRGLAKNYQAITLTFVAAKIYNALLRNRTEPKIENIGRIKMAFGEIDPRRHKFWLSVKFLKVYMLKTYRQQYYLSTSPRPLVPYTAKMEQVLIAYSHNDAI